MTNLITVGDTINANEMISSLEIVKQINFFRQEEGNRSILQHSDLLKIIRAEFSEEIGVGDISETLYTHGQNGQNYPMFQLTLNQAKQILVRESKFVRKAVIAYIDRLEQTLKAQLPSTYLDALKALVASEEVKQTLQLEVKVQREQIVAMNDAIIEMKPKVDYLDKIINSKETVTITQIAADYNMSAKALNKKLYELGVQRKVSGQWVLYTKYMTEGYVFSKTFQFTHKDGRQDVTMNTEWRQKGRIFLYNLLKTVDIIPTIER